MKRILAITLLATMLLLVLGLAVGCGSSSSSGSSGSSGTSGSTSAGSSAVTIQNFAFSPQTVTVSVGDSVTWTNDDSVTHTVEGDGGISSGDLAPGQTYTKTFDTAGTFAYHCTIHPTMTGEVVVQ